MNDKIQKAPMVPPFVRFVCSAVPMVFDDSLSYYEALCALWKWLQDDVVNVINNNATVTEEYIQLTNDMKEYMDNYFDNLDVQEEINNKLDQMVEAGTLQEIIGEYLNATAVWGFDTVADMKASTNLINGSFAKTLGYHTKNDGGSATYKIRTITNDDVVDEMTILEIGDSGNTLIAELILPDVITPEILGAYGDGVHDDSVAIQKAIDLKHHVSISKKYYIANTITIGNQTTQDPANYFENVNIDASNSEITYDGNGYAFKIAGIRGGDLKFGTVVASAGSCFELWSNHDRVCLAYLKISFNRLNPYDKAFYIHNSATGFINEIIFNGGVIKSGNYGFYYETNASSAAYQMGQHRLNNVCFEGCAKCIYMNAIANEFNGFDFNKIRYAENTTAPLFEIIGAVRNFTMNSDSVLYPDRLLFENATLRYFVMHCPVWERTSPQHLLGTGISFNGTRVIYLFDDWYNRVSPTKESGVTGNLYIVHKDNNYQLVLDSLSTTSNAQTLVTAENNRFTPTQKFAGVVSNWQGHLARITIETTGEIRIRYDSAYVGDSFEGTIPFNCFEPEYL